MFRRPKPQRGAIAQQPEPEPAMPATAKLLMTDSESQLSGRRESGALDETKRRRRPGDLLIQRAATARQSTRRKKRSPEERFNARLDAAIDRVTNELAALI